MKARAEAGEAPAAGPAGRVVPRKWYFCVNERGFQQSRSLIAVALASARANTSLRPFAIYNGRDPRYATWLASRGVTVVPHRSSLEEDLRAAYGDRYDQFSGHWLRIDLPLIETEDDVVLYTDFDVMFLGEPVLDRAPALLAAAPEFDIDDRSYFSSGVMVLNLPSLRTVHEAFLAAIRARLHGDFTYPAHDQESYNCFFGPTLLNRIKGRAFEPLSPTLNWKPFWGLNADARIVHFHGPKPRHVHKLAGTTGGTALADTFRSLLRRSPEAYASYAAQWSRYLEEARGLGPASR